MIKETFINGHDAYAEWGVSLTDGGLSALMTPAGNKEYISSKSRLEHGKRVITDNARVDEREVLLPVHITAPTREAFFQRYAAFCAVLEAGSLEIYTRYQATVTGSGANEVVSPTVVYRLKYLSCQQFREYGQRVAKFILRVSEPNPNDRSV